jgi:glycyl-tRNA synthetase beta chain
MADCATLLVELRTEELPPKSLKRLGEAFAQGLAAGLRERDFLTAGSTVRMFATPRRLAVAIAGVLAVAPDKPFKEKLLPVSVAFDAAGKPTAALLGKLKAKQLTHLDPTSLQREHDGKTEVLVYADVAKGGPLINALQSALESAIEKLPIAKVMSYGSVGAYYNNQKFVRPAHGLVALHGTDVIDVHALGLSAGRRSAGHRFLGRPDLDIATADAYEPTLEAEGKVIPDFAKRREAIVTALERASEHAQVIKPDALLDEVTSLVEWPTVYVGTFDRTFLDVPQECLILTMQQNQKYFALADDSGALRHRFLVVSNLPTADPAAIIRGNERVLRARLADAKFFYDQDRRQSLASRLGKLRSIVYHNKLGSQADRMDRLRFLAAKIAPLLTADMASADRAAQLAKADLTTDMVGEFPEMQGIMGRYYALNDGESAVVADAISQHYWPKVAGGPLPQHPVSQTVALADKLEALAGMFGIGQVPTGDKDPFGLRRAALGLIRILIERQQPVPLSQLVAIAFDAFDAVPAVTPQPEPLLDFLYERLRGVLREQGYSALEVAAVVDAHPSQIDDLPARLDAVRAFSDLPEAGSLASANKRIVNILKKSGVEAAPAVDRTLLDDGAEHDLYAAMQSLLPVVHDHVGRGDYTAALRALASARAPVDRFFDDVMVMADDPAVRGNRLALLRGLAEAMNQVADISKLAV